MSTPRTNSPPHPIAGAGVMDIRPILLTKGYLYLFFRLVLRVRFLATVLFFAAGRFLAPDLFLAVVRFLAAAFFRCFMGTSLNYDYLFLPS
jgi:hypothetical protein